MAATISNFINIICTFFGGVLFFKINNIFYLFIAFEEIVRYLELIDSNKNGEIDDLEFELSLLTTEDLEVLLIKI